MARRNQTVQMDSMECRRLMSVGQLDAAFGSAGTVAVYQSFPHFGQTTELVQNDGKILLGGNDRTVTDHTVAAIVRLNADGSVDKSFGKNGEATFVFGADSDNSGISQMAMQPDGKIVAVGGEAFRVTSAEEAGIARLNSDGTLDTTFNGSGIEVYGNSTSERGFRTVKVMADGRILVAGEAFPATDFLIARFNSDGTPDKTLNGSGLRWIDMGGQDELTDLATTPDGEIIATGYMHDFRKFVAVKLTSSGAVDHSFGQNGRRYDNDFLPLPNEMFLQADGSFVVAGTDMKMGAAELHDYSATGQPSGFGTVSFTAFTPEFGITVQEPDGKFILAGQMASAEGGPYTSDVAVRVNVNGKIDTTFGDNGFATFGDGTDIPYGIAIAPDGGILLGVDDEATGANTVSKLQGDSAWVPAGEGSMPVGVTLGSDGTLTVTGTASNDTIGITTSAGNVVVDRNGVQSFFATSSVKKLIVNGMDGDDTINSTLSVNSTIDGGAGNDLIRSGSGDDLLHGDAGNDSVFGNGGNDSITGDDGKDSLRGGDGNDTIDGGSSNDRIYGDNGNNLLIGEGGDDRFYADAFALVDTILGGAGTDYASFNTQDHLSSIAYQI